MKPVALKPAVPSKFREFLDALPLACDGGRRLHRLPDGRIVGDWFGCELSSAFQPIVDPAQQRSVGFHALLRVLGSDDHALSPWPLFSANHDDAHVVRLDRLARTVHALNFLASATDDEALLFLNVHGRLLATVTDDHGAAFRRVADAIGLPAARIVIETPLAASRQPALLAFVLQNYHRNGFKLAVNVESAAQWRVLAGRIPPHYVRLDSTRFRAAALDAETGLLLDSGAQPVLGRIGQPLAQVRPGVLVQGFAYGEPETGAASATLQG